MEKATFEEIFWEKPTLPFMTIENNVVYTIKIPAPFQLYKMFSKYGNGIVYYISVEHDNVLKLLKIQNLSLRNIIKENEGNTVRIKRTGEGFDTKYEVVRE